ncbi:DNA/RNA non-specific endonuclease [Chitinophaga silvisoli]|uniref:Type VII secretion system protein EssD-like domain-containing protein n=1 Tax=Chitinophaga silvisoli TaxID=2291814 RepID=A0A3E1NZ06_9BACT|nr:DNA/RNA non-specific endonuclease [Chitinophaga silvisoli]RFM33187.1 hypothetical protein DXN04_19340 [Chitinophaga silvisoli]
MKNKNTDGGRTSSMAAANNHRSSGISQPAVDSFQKTALDKEREIEPFSIPDVNGKEPFHLKPVMKPGGTENKMQAPMPLPVLQRKPMSKTTIFEDQVKWIVVQGIARIYSGKGNVGSEAGKKLAEKLDTLRLIDISKLKDSYRNVKEAQIQLLRVEKDGLLAGITQDALNENNLILEAATAAEVSKAKWELYKTSIDDKDHKATGLEGEAQHDSQKKVQTAIEWAPTVHGQGKSVTAKVLASDHPLGSVSDNKAINKSVQTLSTAAGNQDYIAGHLLNHKLGGPGNDARNLTAIPGDVNSEMANKVEDNVVEWVNKEHQIVYYKTEVDYDNDAGKDYASMVKITFGSYKESTDFSNPNPDNDLENKHIFELPINKPSQYLSTNSGYIRDDNSLSPGYKDISGKAYSWAGVKKVDTSAKLKFDKEKDVVLNTEAHIKIEFIAAAIYSLPISKLQKQVEEITKEKTEAGKQLELLTDKNKELVEEQRKLSVLKFQLDSLQYQYDNEVEELKRAEAYSESLEKEKSEMHETIVRLEKTIDSQNELAVNLTEQLEEYKYKARQRAENLGFELGFFDGLNGKEANSEEWIAKRRVSLGSTAPFRNGYSRGLENGKLTREKNEENEQLKERIKSLEEKNKAITEELERLRPKEQAPEVESKTLHVLPDNIEPTLGIPSPVDEEQEKDPDVDEEEIVSSSEKTSNIDWDPSQISDSDKEVTDDKEQQIKKLFSPARDWVVSRQDQNFNKLLSEQDLRKYQGLAIMIHLDIISPSEAYKAYPHVKTYNNLFTKAKKCENHFNLFKGKFGEK